MNLLEGKLYLTLELELIFQPNFHVFSLDLFKVWEFYEVKYF